MERARYFCPILTKFGTSKQIFMEVPNNIYHRNPSSGISADTCGQTDMTKVIGAFRDYVKVPKTSLGLAANSIR
jgi:hypothetical protein